MAMNIPTPGQNYNSPIQVGIGVEDPNNPNNLANNKFLTFDKIQRAIQYAAQRGVNPPPNSLTPDGKKDWILYMQQITGTMDPNTLDQIYSATTGKTGKPMSQQSWDAAMQNIANGFYSQNPNLQRPTTGPGSTTEPVRIPLEIDNPSIPTPGSGSSTNPNPGGAGTTTPGATPVVTNPQAGGLTLDLEGMGKALSDFWNGAGKGLSAEQQAAQVQAIASQYMGSQQGAAFANQFKAVAAQYPGRQFSITDVASIVKTVAPSIQIDTTYVKDLQEREFDWRKQQDSILNFGGYTDPATGQWVETEATRQAKAQEGQALLDTAAGLRGPQNYFQYAKTMQQAQGMPALGFAQQLASGGVGGFVPQASGKSAGLSDLVNVPFPGQLDSTGQGMNEQGQQYKELDSPNSIPVPGQPQNRDTNVLTAGNEQYGQMTVPSANKINVRSYMGMNDTQRSLLGSAAEDVGYDLNDYNSTIKRFAPQGQTATRRTFNG